MDTYPLWVKVRSGRYATVAYVSLFVDVESVKSFGQTRYDSGNRNRTASNSLDKGHIAGYRTGSLENDYGSAFLLQLPKINKLSFYLR